MINTGDNLAHPQAVPAVVQALGGLLSVPGLFVFGSNDYFGPTAKNPLKYFKKNHKRSHGEPLPWQDLRAAFTERGWLDATHSVRELEVAGVRVAAAGVDDPHIGRDRYETIEGRPNPLAHLRLGLTHSPEPRVLDRFADDGYDLVMAGHTHGGQLCLPFYGALVTNCHLDRSRVKGPSTWGCVDAPARERRTGHLPVRAGPLLLPSRGVAADPHPGLRRRLRFRPRRVAATDQRRGQLMPLTRRFNASVGLR